MSDNYTGSEAALDGKWQAMIWPPMPNADDQCINPSNGTNKGYRLITANTPGNYTSQIKGPNFNCVRHPIMDLTSDGNAVKAKIDQLTAVSNQGTIIAPGISWGMRLQSPQEPFSKGAGYSTGTRKVIIVLTDGEQTTEAPKRIDTCHEATNSHTEYAFDPAEFKLGGSKATATGPDDLLTPYGYLKDSDPFSSSLSTWDDVKTELKNISLAACEEAKKKPAGGGAIEIYSIAVSSAAGPGTDVYSLLRSCATSTDKFFYANDSYSLTTAFKDIAKSVLKVRIMQ